jgi:hypothetical protein
MPSAGMCVEHVLHNLMQALTIGDQVAIDRSHPSWLLGLGRYASPPLASLPDARRKCDSCPHGIHSLVRTNSPVITRASSPPPTLDRTASPRKADPCPTDCSPPMPRSRTPGDGG